MRSLVSSITAVGIVLTLAGCDRVVLLDCDDVPPPDPAATEWPAICAEASPVLCREPESGERCIPQGAECRPDGDARCLLSADGLEAPSLEVVCLTGDVDDEEVLRTTRTCSELLQPPDEDDPPLL